MPKYIRLFFQILFFYKPSGYVHIASIKLFSSHSLQEKKIGSYRLIHTDTHVSHQHKNKCQCNQELHFEHKILHNPNN